MAPSAVSAYSQTEFLPTPLTIITSSSRSFDRSLQKPTTVSSIETNINSQFETADPLLKRNRVKEECAAALRILSKQGYDHFVSGHVSCRDPIDPNTFWVNPFGLACGLITASNLVHVSLDGKTLGGGQESFRLPSESGYIIDSGIYRARPDVNAICHAHTPFGTTFSTLGIPFEYLTHDSCAFYNDISVYGNFNGVVLESEEGELIQRALGSNKALILQNHGNLTVGSSLRSTMAWFIMLERECQIQVLASTALSNRNPALSPIKVNPEEAQYTYNRLGNEAAGTIFAGPYFQMIEAECASSYKQ